MLATDGRHGSTPAAGYRWLPSLSLAKTIAQKAAGRLDRRPAYRRGGQEGAGALLTPGFRHTAPEQRFPDRGRVRNVSGRKHTPTATQDQILRTGATTSLIQLNEIPSQTAPEAAAAPSWSTE